MFSYAGKSVTIKSLFFHGIVNFLPLAFFLSLSLFHVTGFQDILEVATTWPLNPVRSKSYRTQVARGPRAWRTFLAATSTSITPLSALNLSSFLPRRLHRGPSGITARDLYVSILVLPRQNNRSYSSGCTAALLARFLCAPTERGQYFNSSIFFPLSTLKILIQIFVKHFISVCATSYRESY